MKRISTALLVWAIATSAFAGITYRFTSTTSGVADKTTRGIIKSDAGLSRIEITENDDTMFPAGSVVLTRGNVFTILNAAKKTYYELDLDAYAQQALAISKMSAYLTIALVDPQASVHDDGAGEAIEGYPTRRAVVKTSFKVASNVTGAPQQMNLTIASESRIWLTDKLPASAASLFETSRIHTGVPAIDKILQATASLHGFPLKQVTTSRVFLNGGDPVTTTTTSVMSDIRNATVAPSEFVVPSGYTKVDDPVRAMLKKSGLD